MTVRLVTQTVRDPKGQVVGLANPDSWGEIDLQSAIWHIENHVAAYYVGSTGHRKALEVVVGIDGKYLRCGAAAGKDLLLEDLPD